jgi:hypothetical protein
MLKSIANQLFHIKGLDERSLRRFRILYLYYPQLTNPIRGTMTPELQDEQKCGILSPEGILKNGVTHRMFGKGHIFDEYPYSEPT